MLSSYPVGCPHAECGWKGNLVPSRLQGGLSEEITAMQRAWFRCPHCRNDWEVRIDGDRVTVQPADLNHSRSLSMRLEVELVTIREAAGADRGP